jgi:hypothetical protein
MSVGCAKTAAVLSVLYAGVNAHQLLAVFADVREKARLFSEIAGGAGGPSRLRLVRALFYLAAPLAYLWSMVCAGLPGAFLIAAGAKFWLSSFVGLRTERRLLRGEEYRARDHRLARVDALLNIALAAGAVWLILAMWA